MIRHFYVDALQLLLTGVTVLSLQNVDVILKIVASLLISIFWFIKLIKIFNYKK